MGFTSLCQASCVRLSCSIIGSYDVTQPKIVLERAYLVLVGTFNFKNCEVNKFLLLASYLSQVLQYSVKS